MLWEFLRGAMKSKYVRLLILLFFLVSIYILSFPYPWGEGVSAPGAPKNEHSGPGWQESMWSGGTIPDENAYFQWAWIYYTTGRNYVPLEEIGPDKIQHFNLIIGNSPQDSYFLRVKISQVTDKWQSRLRTVSIEIYNGLSMGISGVPVDLINKNGGYAALGITDEDGRMEAEVPPGIYRAVGHIDDSILYFEFATDFHNLDYPIISDASLESFSGGFATVKIHVEHYINGNLSGVEIHVNKNSRSAGYTDENGNFYLQVRAGGAYDITVIKRTLHIAPPVGSVVVEVNGKYALANRWAPGYSYLLIPFWVAGLQNFVFLFTFSIGSISMYLLARRLYGNAVSFYATFLLMFSGLALMMLFSRGMADYATMAFSTLGIMLGIESLQKRKNENAINSLLAFFGGLALGFSVIIRYSTVTVALAPLAYMGMKLVGDRKSKRFKKELVMFSLFLAALAVMGLVLISYNTALFGGPLNSGYQMSHRVEFSNGTARIETPGTTMFEKYFHPSLESIQNIFERILPQLFILLPTLFIAPPGFFLDYRKSRAWILLLWMLPTLIIYMQLHWVGRVPYEDMRYFLPVLPPTAMLSGLAIEYMGGERKKFLSLILLSSLGFMASFFAINWQLHRREPSGLMWKNPPLYLFALALTAYALLYFFVLSRWIKERKSPIALEGHP